MLKILTDFPADVLAVSASGKVTAADYRDTLVPAVEEKLRLHRPLGLFYEIGPGFTGMELGAMWEDARLGIGHWNDWGRVAVVTDVGWIAESGRLFAPLLRPPMKVFANAARNEAKIWVSPAKAEAA